MKVNKGGRL